MTMKGIWEYMQRSLAVIFHKLLPSSVRDLSTLKCWHLWWNPAPMPSMGIKDVTVTRYDNVKCILTFCLNRESPPWRNKCAGSSRHFWLSPIKVVKGGYMWVTAASCPIRELLQGDTWSPVSLVSFPRTVQIHLRVRKDDIMASWPLGTE